MLTEQRAPTDPGEQSGKAPDRHVSLAGLEHRNQRPFATQPCRSETDTWRYSGNSTVKPRQYQQMTEIRSRKGKCALRCTRVEAVRPGKLLVVYVKNAPHMISDRERRWGRCHALSRADEEGVTEMRAQLREAEIGRASCRERVLRLV